MKTVYIRIAEEGKACKKTAGHEQTLKELGYEVKVDGDHLMIACEKVVEGEVDLSTTEAAEKVLGEVIAAKAMFTYETKFKLPSGKVLHGVLACSQLGTVSALVAKTAITAKARPKGNGLSAILDKLIKK